MPDSGRWAILIAVFSACNLMPAHARIVAVVIGIDAYDSRSIGGLSAAVKDATGLAEALECTGTAREDIRVMTSEEPLGSPCRPTGVDIALAIDWARRRVREGDTFLFYYAGHGISRWGKSYLLPVDARTETPQVAATTSIALEHLANLLSDVRCAHQVTIMDCCRNDPEVARGDEDNRATLGFVRDVEVVGRAGHGHAGAKSSWVMLSCSRGERAFERPDGSHGVFTHFLVEGLLGAAARGGALTVADLCEYVERRVPEYIASQPHFRKGTTQTPWHKSEGTGTVVLAPGRTLAVEPLATTATLRVTGEPVGAQVFVDGGQRGTVPCDIEVDLGAAREKTVEVVTQKAGYRSKGGKATLQRGKVILWRVELALARPSKPPVPRREEMGGDPAETTGAEPGPHGERDVRALPAWRQGDSLLACSPPPGTTIPQTDQWPAVAQFWHNDVEFVIYAKHLAACGPDTRKGKFEVWISVPTHYKDAIERDHTFAPIDARAYLRQAGVTTMVPEMYIGPGDRWGTAPGAQPWLAGTDRCVIGVFEPSMGSAAPGDFAVHRIRVGNKRVNLGQMKCRCPDYDDGETRKPDEEWIAWVARDGETRKRVDQWGLPGNTPVPQAAASSGRPWEPAGTRAGDEIEGPDGGTYVWVPAGEFEMGSEDGDSDEKPVHKVRITRGFWLGKHEVTNEQYAAFLYTFGSSEDADGHELAELHSPDCEIQKRAGRYVVSSGRERHPVVEVSWYGASEYCRHYGLRLPTEAEWEYAARGPRGAKYPWGDEWHASRCCNDGNRGPRGKAAPVGGLGIDASWCGALGMAGGVWEWCNDWYGEDSFRAASGPDPQGPADGQYRVVRGGGWSSDARHCRSAERFRVTPSLCLDDAGFRPVITPSG